MQSSNVPTKFPIPWGNSATYIRTIPTASQIGVHDGYASLTDGFPPLNTQPVAAGGVPPFIQDHNGVLNQTTAWARWFAAGGPVKYDSAFQSAIGGYPAGAVIASATTGSQFWISNADNNTTNPDTGGAGWSPLMPGRLLSFQEFSVVGGYTYTPTSALVRSVLIEGCGGGGGGSGTSSCTSSQASVGAGGSGGSYGVAWLQSGFSGATAVVGGGGAGGTPSANGGNGGLTQFGALQWPGGIGANIAGAAAFPFISAGPVSSTAPSGSNVKIILGEPGGYGLCTNIGVTGPFYGLSGAGGASYFGPGGPSQGQTFPGAASLSPGGGGSGGATSPSGSGQNGGQGGDGKIIIYEYS